VIIAMELVCSVSMWVGLGKGYYCTETTERWGEGWRGRGRRHREPKTGVRIPRT
jgi:hypothetical protein